MYICLCHGVTEKQIGQAVERGARRLKDLRSSLRVTDQCGRCASCARQCLNNTISTKEGSRSR